MAITNKMYATMDTETGEITLSAYSTYNDDWDNNHISLQEIGQGRVSLHESSLNILTNILYQAGIQLVIE